MMDIVIPLTTSQLTALVQEFELLTFPKDFVIVYEHQVPCAGIALIQGQIELSRNAKVLRIIEDGYVLGISELLLGQPVRFDVRLKAESKIILLGKSDIINFRSNGRSELHPILSLFEMAE